VIEAGAARVSGGGSARDLADRADKPLLIRATWDEGGICVVAESCHQTSEAVGLMASARGHQINDLAYKLFSLFR